MDITRDSQQQQQQQQPLLNRIPITKQDDNTNEILIGSHDVIDGNLKDDYINRSKWISVDGNNQQGHLLRDAEAAHGNVIIIDKGNGRARCIRGLKYTVGFLVIFFGVLLIIVQQMGWLDSVDHSIELDGHGNAVEPNTGIKFPLVVEYDAILPGQGKKKVKHHLIGMYLVVNSVASLNVKVLVLGYYVQWDIGKKVLLPWKNKKIDVSHPDPKLVELVTDGKSLPGTLKFVMTMSAPGMSMRDKWGKQLHDLMIKEHADPNTVKEVDDTFHTWLSRGIHTHDRFDFTWGFNPIHKGLMVEDVEDAQNSNEEEDDDPTSYIGFTFNDKYIPPLERSHEMIHILMKDQIKEIGGGMVNLINLLWEH